MTTPAASIESLRTEALAALDNAGETGLDSWRPDWLGRQDGRLPLLLRSVRDQPVESRASFGAAANRLKEELEAALSGRQSALEQRRLHDLATAGALDVTLPGRP